MAPLLLLLRPRRPPLHPLPVPALLRPAVPSPRRSTAAQERRGTTTISTWTTRARSHMHEISRRGAKVMMNLPTRSHVHDESQHGRRGATSRFLSPFLWRLFSVAFVLGAFLWACVVFSTVFSPPDRVADYEL